MLMKFNKLVNSEAFEGTVDGGESVMENFVNSVLQNTVTMEIQKVNEQMDYKYEQQIDNTSTPRPIENLPGTEIIPQQ
ncbi:MAG: hypothetical protein SFW35_09425 [Chitinophagales bacterium]|nr:hypothetical protein [Chitinophagales bacterium]